MARKAKTLTPAEIKARKAELNALLKKQKEAIKPFADTLAATAKALATAKKEADKAIEAAAKAHVAAEAKHAKAVAAAEKGAEKINAQLAALTPAPAAA